MSEHAKAQALRFIRVTVYALAAQLFALGHWPGWWALLPMLAGAAETGLRELMPVKPLPAVASVLASDLELSKVKTAPATGTSLTGITIPPGQTGAVSNPPPSPPLDGVS